MPHTDTQQTAANVSTDGPRNDIPAPEAAHDPHTALSGAFAEAIPGMLKGVAAVQQPYARQVLGALFDRALSRDDGALPGDVPAFLQSLETQFKGVLADRVDPVDAATNGLDMGILESFTDGVGLVAVPGHAPVTIHSALRVGVEHARDKVLLRSAPALLEGQASAAAPKASTLPTEGQLIVFRCTGQDATGIADQWTTAAEYARPRLPRLANDLEFADEALHIFPSLRSQDLVDRSAPLPISSSALATDMLSALNTALDKVGRTDANGQHLRALSYDFGTGLAHLQRLLVAKDTYMLDPIGPTHKSAQLSGIVAHEYVDALCRTMQTSIESWGVFNTREIRDLVGAFMQLKRAGHLLLHVMGVDSTK